MHYAVLSDVHANLESLNAVVNDIRRRDIRKILFAGDAVGYGPSPDECIDLLVSVCDVLVAGNHDWGAIGLTDTAFFNRHARIAVEWTAGVMTEKSAGILKSLPLTKECDNGEIFLVHATPKDPGAWHYLFTLRDAEINFRHFEGRFCFLGHSHMPFIIEKGLSGDAMMYHNKALIKKGCRYIINTGSVGQPRDGDCRACYAVMTDEEVQIVRVPYDIERVQYRMREAHLPVPLIERLSAGV